MKRKIIWGLCLCIHAGIVSTGFAQTYYKNTVTPSVQRKWTNFDLASVRLTGNSYAKDRQDQNVNYLLSIDEERMLLAVMRAAGLTTNNKSYYGGWQGNSNNGFGNYLSALSMMYASTGNSQLLTKLNWMVDKIDSAQKRFSYLGGYFYNNSDTSNDAYTKLMTANNNVVLTNFNNEDFYFWDGMADIHFYHLHRIYAGLRDAYVYANNSKAKDAFLKGMDWVCTWSNLITSDQSFQLALKCEHGGIAELLTDAYSLTNDNKYKTNAYRWMHKSGFADKLTANEDILRGKHGNSQDPKFLGMAWYYEMTGDAALGTAARNSLNMIIDRHTLPNGGHGFWERYGEPGKYTDHLGYTSTEECCTYNTIKFTRNMINLDGQVKYMDFYEKQLYNHILGSVDPTTTNSGGGFTYYHGLAPGMWKDYMSENLMACCWETGIESQSKYGEAIYFNGSQGLLVNLYMPSTLNWSSKSFQATLETSFPENDTINFTINQVGSFNQDIYFRIPHWLKPNDAEVFINNINQNITITPGTLLKLQKTWQSGDAIKLILKRRLRIEPSNEPNVSAVFIGPILLVPDLGSVPRSDYVNEVWSDNGYERDSDFPNINAAQDSISSWLQKNSDFSYTTQGLSTNYTFKPLYSTHHRRFSIYSRIASTNEKNTANSFITDRVLPGISSDETAHNISTTGSTYSGVYRSRRFRDVSNGGTVSYDLKVNPYSGVQHYIMVTYQGFEDNNHGFYNIYVDNTLVGQETSIVKLKQFTWPKKYFTIPKSLTDNKTSVTVKIESTSGKTATFFGLALVTETYLDVYDPDSKITPNRLEAERGQHNHTVKFPLNASDIALVADITDFVQFNNTYVRKGGNYSLKINYAAGMSGTTNCVLKVNGSAQTITLPQTASWTTFNSVTATVALNNGMNTIRIEKGAQYFDLDYIEIIGLNNSNNLISGATYKIISKNSNKVMEVQSSSMSNEGNVAQNTWNGGDNQKWTVIKIGEGTYKIINLNSGKSLDVSSVSFANGANIFQYDFLDGKNQKWYINQLENGFYKIQSVNSGKVADVEGFSTNDGANISQYQYTGTDNQLWKFELINDIPTGNYRILARHSGKSLEVKNGGTSNGDSIKISAYAGNNYQNWKIESVGSGYYKIICEKSGKGIDVYGSSSSNGAQIVQWDYLGGDNQKWSIVPTDEGYFKIISKSNGKLLEVSGGSYEDGANGTQWQDLNIANQQWKLERIVTETYAPQNAQRIVTPMEETKKFEVFPNPANQSITIKLPKEQRFTLTIKAANGQTVLTRNLMNPSSIINTSNFKNGIYFFQVEGGKNYYIKKILIQH